MLKFLLYAAVIYLVYKISRFLTGVKRVSRSGNSSSGDKKPYSELDIQDGEFEDLDS